MRVDISLRAAPIKREWVPHGLFTGLRASLDVLPVDRQDLARQQQVVNRRLLVDRQAPIDWLPGPHGWAVAE